MPVRRPRVPVPRGAPRDREPHAREALLRPRFVLLLAPLVCLAAAAPARARVPDAVLHGEWSEVRTPHVRVLSDAGSDRAARLAEVLERLHEQAERTAPSLVVQADRSRTAFAFGSGDAFRAYLPTVGGRPEEDAGLFQPTPTGGFLLLEPGPADAIDAVALHEYTHALLRESVPSAPPWLHEGLAQYFSTLRVHDADVRVGEPMPEAIAWLRGHDLMPVSELLAIGFGSADYHGGAKRATFYAESWLLVHMLLNENVQDLPRFERYLAALRRGDDAREAFRATFGDEKRVHWRLELYAQRPSYSGMNWNFSQPFRSLVATNRAHVPNVELVDALGSMLVWRNGAEALADEHLAVAQRLDADAAPTRAFAAELASRRAGGAPPPQAEPVAPVAAVESPLDATVSTDAPATDAVAPEELAALTPLLQRHRYRQARLLASELLARPLSPGSRTCLERLLRLLSEPGTSR